MESKWINLFYYILQSLSNIYIFLLYIAIFDKIKAGIFIQSGNQVAPPSAGIEKIRKRGKGIRRIKWKKKNRGMFFKLQKNSNIKEVVN